MLRKAILASAALIYSAAAAVAAPTIVAGDHLLLPNTAGQTITITTLGEAGDEFEGANLYLSIAAGGPLVTGFDLIGTGTLFNGNNTGQQDFGDPAYLVPTLQPAYFVSADDGTVGPNGVLAILTLDTTNVAPGVYTLSLTHPVFDPSFLPLFTDQTTILQNGTLTVLAVPEPGSLVLGLFAAAGLSAVAIRRHRGSSLS